MRSPLTASERARLAGRVTWTGFWVNLALTGLKLAAGIAGASAAMIADAVHSMSDFATDIVVLASFRVVRKPADHSHDWGHGKFETLAAAIIGAALAVVGLGIVWSAAHRIVDAVRGVPPEAPGLLALLAALLSIAVKEWLYRLTLNTGERIGSGAVVANAWHHRSDAFSSIGTAAGIGGAILLGGGMSILDPLAAVVVSCFILRMAVRIMVSSVRELSEESLDAEVEREIRTIAAGVDGSLAPHELRTRRIGGSVAIDLHICVDGSCSITRAHDIASGVEEGLRRRFGEESFVSVHVEPDDPEHVREAT